MSYSTIIEMFNSASLRERIIACAAQEGATDPNTWAQINIWKIIKNQTWVDDWKYAKDTYNVNQNPDIGARIDVISDGDILSAVQFVGTV